MKRILLITIVGSVVATLAAIGAPRPLASPTPAQTECDCSNLKTLQIELSNALLLQQAFTNKIPELRAMETEGRASMAELQRWAKSDARAGLKQVPGLSGSTEVDYKPWGDKLSYQDDGQVTAKFTNEKLCGRSDESTAALEDAMKKSACAGIARAIQEHEDWHLNFCKTIGYRPYWLGMHGADRAKEEVEAYGKQIAVLRGEIAKVLKKNCVSYRASGNAGGDTVFSGDICDLEKPFTLKTNNPFLGSFEFVPSSSSGGKWSFSTTNGVIGGGSGTYTITGSDTEKTGIEMTGWSTGTVRGATRSGGGTVHINLSPLDKECKP